MKLALISTKQDIASINLKKALLPYFNKTTFKFDGNQVYSKDNVSLYTIDDSLLYSDNLDKKIDAEFFLFLSKHKSKIPLKRLCIHSIGNYSKPLFGGKEKCLVNSPASLIKTVFNQLTRLNFGYQATLETTHHGPYLEKPSFFVEIGSSKTDWENKKAAIEVASALYSSIFNLFNYKSNYQYNNSQYKIAVGLGGLHYALNFNKVLQKTNIAVSHIFPKHSLEFIDQGLIKQAIEKTYEKVDFILLDWKSLGKYKQKIIQAIKEINLPSRRINSFF